MLEQRDTYFAARRGRLKLREQGDGASELIAYRRPDDAASRARARTCGRRSPRRASWRGARRRARHGRRGRVKRRRLFIWEGVRIHLDEVDGLGSFIEFEAVLPDAGDLEDGAGEGRRGCALSWRSSDERSSPVGYADLLLDGPQALLRAADAAMRNAYAPYSKFTVGAAVRGRSGAIYAGANVENVAYPQGQCAEASALGALVAAGETAITAVAVVAERVERCPPCGGCRQRLAEFGAAGHAGVPRPPGHEFDTTTLGELLPGAFGREELGRERPLRSAEHAPRVGVVLGSGLGAVADAVEDPVVIGYDELPGFPRPSVAGHAGRAVLGYDRRASRSPCSRAGRTCTKAATPTRCARRCGRCRAAGAEMLVLTNAAGSLRPEVGPGQPDGDHRPHQPDRREPADRARTTTRSGRASRRCATPTTRRCWTSCARRQPRRRRRARRGRLPGGQRAELRDAGGDPRLPDAGRRRRRHVDRPGDDPRPPLRPAGGRGLGDHQPRRGHERRAAEPRADAARRRSAPPAT